MFRFLTRHEPLPSHVQKYSRECLQKSIQRLVEKYDTPSKKPVANLPSTETMTFYPHPLLFSFSLLFFTFISSIKGKK